MSQEKPRHPLQIHVASEKTDCTLSLNLSQVVNMVFRYLPIQDLRSCRCVCKFWSDLANQRILTNGVISFHAEQTDTITDIRRWIDAKEWIESEKAPSDQLNLNLKCESITHYSYPDLAMIMGPRVRSFITTAWWGDDRDLTYSDYEDLLLYKCPNLEELSVAASPMFKAPHAANFLLFAEDEESRIKLKLKTLVVHGEVRPDPRFWRILSVCPDLNNLQLSCEISEDFWCPESKHFPNLVNLETLEVRSYANESISSNFSQYFMSRTWPRLKSLTYECYTLSDAVMRQCSEHISSTLVRLHMVLFNKIFLPWPKWKGKDWMIPPTMNNLEHFMLEVDDHCEGPVFCRTLVAAIMLPNLKSLRMKVYDNAYCSAMDWPIGLFQKMIKGTPGVRMKVTTEAPGTSAIGHRRGRLLKLLQLPPRFQDLSCIKTVLSYFPNLTELVLPFASIEVVRGVMQRWKQLERLALTLMDDDDVNWTNVLTDDNYTCNYNVYSGSLENLRNLRSLEIILTRQSEFVGLGEGFGEHSPSPELLANRLTNDLIFKGLIKLPYLQRIVIKGHDVR